MSKQEKWRRFESLVASIQRQFVPQAKIIQNEKILGNRSKALREIDITIRQHIGQYDIFIAIDCKDYKRRINVKDVEEFIGLIEDVSANKGAIISASGFSKAAKTRAANSGIEIYRLVDAAKHDWQCYVSIPTLCDFRRIKSFSLKFTTTGPFIMRPQEFRTTILFNKNGEPIDAIGNLLAKEWNSGSLPVEPGEHRDLKLADVTTFIKTDDIFYQVEVTASILVEKNLYFGQLPVVECKGFENQFSGELITNSIETADLDVEEVERNWQKVHSEEDLAVKPLLRQMARDNYPLTKLDD